MVLGEDGLEVVRENLGLFGVAIGNVCDQVDEVMERLRLLGRGRRGGNEEDLALGLILVPLPPEIVDVGLRIPPNLVLQTRAVSLVSSV
jgi:hypothetical protein